MMTYPLLDQVERANHLQICLWFMKLPNPKSIQQHEIFKRIFERYQNFGGTTPEVQKMIATGVKTCAV